MIKLNDLNFRACEGYYSKAARACTWPCSITQMDSKDEMDQVYEALVHWADAVIVSSPIRWGAASSLYFKMAERLNCVQNAVTIRNRHRGALNGDSYRLATAKKTQRRSAHGHGQNPKHQTKEILPPKSKSVLKKTKITPGFKALFS
jgi:multimeric flavodoxin WrbA